VNVRTQPAPALKNALVASSGNCYVYAIIVTAGNIEVTLVTNVKQDAGLECLPTFSN
jgi:hypothetical protein